MLLMAVRNVNNFPNTLSFVIQTRNIYANNSHRFLSPHKNCNGIYLSRLKENFARNVVQRKSNVIASQYCTTTTRESMREPKRAVGLMGWFLALVPITTFLLGTWQVKRRKWKQKLIETLHEKTTANPVELPNDLEDLQALEYYPVRVRGEFDHSKEIYLGPRSLLLHGDSASQGGLIAPKGGQSGVLVVTPFRLTDRNMTILVQRGWVPTSHKNPSTRAEGQITGEVELVGIVRLSEKRAPFVPQNKRGSHYWFYRDVENMAYELSTEPVFLDAVASTTVPNGPVGGQTRVTLRNEHMSYIFTWYSLSGATAYLWYRHFIQRLPLK